MFRRFRSTKNFPSCLDAFWAGYFFKWYVGRRLKPAQFLKEKSPGLAGASLHIY